MTGGYLDWDENDFKLPEKFLLNDDSTLAEAITVFYAAGGYDFFKVDDPKYYGDGWLDFVGGLYRDIVDGKYKDDGKPFSIPLSAEKISGLIEQGVPDIFTGNGRKC